MFLHEEEAKKASRDGLPDWEVVASALVSLRGRVWEEQGRVDECSSRWEFDH